MTQVRALFVVAAAALALGVTVMLAPKASSPAEAAAASEPPNFIVITTDDQSRHSFRPELMPRTFRLLKKKGTSFSNGLAAPPLCCPSRAGFLTAQYPHNHLVTDNHPGYGDLDEPDNTLPVWLQNASYRTGFVGKYLNGTSDVLGARPAPGWDYWYAIYGNPEYYGTTVSNQGTRKTLSERDYITTQFNKKASQFLRRGATGSPFFLWLAQYAPHGRRTNAGYCTGAVPEPLGKDLDNFRHANFPKSPSFNERNVRDKPRFIRNRDRLTRSDKQQIKKNYRCTLAAMQEVDRGVADIVRRLKRSGDLSNTIIIFTSDNGFFFGEHRIAKGKNGPYEEALRVPLAMRAGQDALGSDAVASISEPVAQIDFAPTFLELARAQPCRSPGDCRRMDGRSLVGLLQGSDPQWPDDRGVLAETKGLAATAPTGTSVARTVGGPCGFAAIRTRDSILMNSGERTGSGCGDGFTEFYDLQADPFELRNGADKPVYQGAVAELRARLASLRRCSGIKGRDAPEPDSTFCE